jgi:uncharacterized protein YjbJ (UPF0337 family)
MDKDRVTGKVKDVEGRIERHAGEWTGDKKKQVRGAAKQAEGKVQNAWGKVKDATREALKEGKDSDQIEDSEDTKENEPEPRSSRR